MRYKLIDLFCGCGGMTLGFAGNAFCNAFESVFALDNDPAAIQSHRANFGPHAVCGDIEACARGEDGGVPKAHVVIGGPPCQGFSLLNKQRKGDARRALWRPYLDIVARSEASAFVIENVPGLLKSAECAAVRARADELGFETRAAVLNAADYGTPQTRKRAFILGWKKGPGAAPVFPPAREYAAPGDDAPLPGRRTVRQAVGDLPPPQGRDIREAPPPLDLHFGRNPTAKSLERYKAVPPGGNRFDLQRNRPDITPACWIRKTSGGTDLFGRLWWDRPSVTIRTEFFKPEKGRYLHPEQHRPITHREAARLMGFPDDFQFRGSKTETARQIGNAVPPHLAAAVAREVAAFLDRTAK